MKTNLNVNELKNKMGFPFVRESKMQIVAFSLSCPILNEFCNIQNVIFEHFLLN